MRSSAGFRSFGGGVRQRHAAVAAAMISTVGLTLTLSGAPAGAVTPPTVDASALVRSAPVAPPEPTEQRTLCAKPLATGSHDTSKPSAAQKMMNLPEAWRFSRGKGQRVAVIDTGVTPHPRLGRVVGGGDYVSSGTGLADCDAHGTLVAGIIAARPSSRDAFAGVAPDASLISIRQSSGAYSAKDRRSADDADPTVGSGYGSVRTLANAVVRAVDLGATVINISEVACAPAGDRLNDASLGAAVKYAYDRDVVVVVAAGNLSQNSGCQQQNAEPTPGGTGWGSVSTVASPAWFTPYVLAVGSVDAGTGAPSGFSLHGPWVAVAAPGTDIVSLDSTRGSSKLVDAQQGRDGPVPIGGTSFATPYVAGTVALVRSRYPELSAKEVMIRIVRTAHGPGTGHDTAIGYGVLDPVAALTNQIPRDMPDAAEPRAIAAPTPEVPPDHTARNVALIGTGVCAALIAAVLAIALPHRRVTRLDPDEF